MQDAKVNAPEYTRKTILISSNTSRRIAIGNYLHKSRHRFDTYTAVFTAIEHFEKGPLESVNQGVYWLPTSLVWERGNRTSRSGISVATREQFISVVPLDRDCSGSSPRRVATEGGFHPLPHPPPPTLWIAIFLWIGNQSVRRELRSLALSIFAILPSQIFTAVRKRKMFPLCRKLWCLPSSASFCLPRFVFTVQLCWDHETWIRCEVTQSFSYVVGITFQIILLLMYSV